MTSHDIWVAFLGERAAAAADAHHRALTEDGDGEPPAEETTPLHDLTEFVALRSDDMVKTDLELTHTRCGQVICDVEPDDTLELLVKCAANHVCTGPEKAAR